MTQNADYEDGPFEDFVVELPKTERRILKGRVVARNADSEDVIVIGPECFASKGEEVICWKGENYYRQPPPPNGRSGTP